MSDDSPGLLHTANRALEMAQSDHLELAELKNGMHLVTEELGYLRTFNLRLLGMLKLQLNLDDHALDTLVLQVAGAQEKLAEKPGSHLAPPCAFCGRPMQVDSVNCIYCGRKPA